jgi:ABC-type dipeptide/oligopeptide/nickel transport system permease subunit
MGLALAIFSCVFATAKDLVSKRLAGQLDGTVSTFASFAFAVPYYVLVLGVLYLFGQEPFAITRAFLLLVLLRSIISSCPCRGTTPSSSRFPPSCQALRSWAVRTAIKRILHG